MCRQRLFPQCRQGPLQQIVAAQFVKDSLALGPHGLGRDFELGGQVLLRETVDQQAHYSEFTRAPRIDDMLGVHKACQRKKQRNSQWATDSCFVCDHFTRILVGVISRLILTDNWQVIKCQYLEPRNGQSKIFCELKNAKINSHTNI